MNIVRDGYDHMANRYIRERSHLKIGRYVTKLLKRLKPQSRILDLGCGAGTPVDDVLVRHGHKVTGLDVSLEMIKHARESVPGAEYEVRDIMTLKPHEYQVDAVVSLYVFFHLPRREHLTILRRIHSFLPVGGWLLVTMGEKDYEGVTPYLGQPMYWSQWGPAKNRVLIERAGFQIELDELDHSGGEVHQVILATSRKV